MKKSDEKGRKRRNEKKNYDRPHLLSLDVNEHIRLLCTNNNPLLSISSVIMPSVHPVWFS